MNFRVIRTILRKELLDTLRDKRTLVMMIGLPIVLYPALLIFGMQAAVVQQNKLDETRSRVSVEGPSAGLLKEWLTGVEMVDVVEQEDASAALLGGDIEAVVSSKEPLEPVLEQGGSASVDILFDSTELESRDAENRVESALEKVIEKIRAERLSKAGLEQAYIEPIKLENRDQAPAEKTTGTILGALLPPLMIIMIALGAFYPAIDLTAGEKERGTFETLLSTPATKLEIVSGKFLTVFAMAMTTGILNLASMSVTLLFMVSQFASEAGTPKFIEEFQLPLGAFFIILLVLIPMGFLLSALMMSVAVFARSFKEAQNYITPFFLVIMLPAVLGTLPGTELGPFSQFAPIYNVILLFKELMTGKAELEEIGAVFISTAAFASMALWFSAWLFQREEVVLSEERGIPLSFRRDEFRPRATLTPGTALGWYSVMLIALFYLGSLVQQWNLIGGLLITQFLLLLGLTAGLLWFLKVDLKSAFYLHPLSLPGTIGALLTGCGSILLLMQFSAYHNKFLPMPKMLEEQFTKLFETQDVPGGLITLIFAVGIAPAICEEFVMRGAVLSGLRQRLNVWASILVVGLLFGILHISVYRILPTAILGCVLTYLVLRTGSIWASVMIHGINNTFAILLVTGNVPGWVTRALNIEQVEERGLPWMVVLLAAVLFASGVMLTEWARRRRLNHGAH